MSGLWVCHVVVEFLFPPRGQNNVALNVVIIQTQLYNISTFDSVTHYCERHVC